ncbi:MAG: kinase [Actinomycetota bacterium]|jgi:NAD+ kinase|nr:kinase [Actinomycetota bacterium]
MTGQPSDPHRCVLLLGHTGRAEALEAVLAAADRLAAAGVQVRVLAEEAAELALPGAHVVTGGPDAAEGCELVVVFGGDGTLLRAAELARSTRTPILGVNLGHVGFLAEAEPEDLEATVQRVVARDYTVEERMTIDVSVFVGDELVTGGWALNEASVEKASRERMLEVGIEVDHRPLSRWGCDGVIFATPTGSTAYAFSAGGPVVWPEVEALLMVPISAHALFARPMVVAPTSVLTVKLLSSQEGAGVLWCDGRRSHALPAGARVEARRGRLAVRLARLHTAPFTDRLVAKFDLPVRGWRGGTDADRLTLTGRDGRAGLRSRHRSGT